MNKLDPQFLEELKELKKLLTSFIKKYKNTDSKEEQKKYLAIVKNHASTLKKITPIIKREEELLDTLPRIIQLYNSLEDLIEISLVYAPILNDFKIIVQSDEYHDDFLKYSANVANISNNDILDYSSEFEAYLKFTEKQKDNVNSYTLHDNLQFLYNKLQLFPNILGDVAELRDAIASYKKVQPLVDSFTQYINSTLLENEIKIHIKSGNTFTSERMDLLKECIEKCESLLSAYDIANYYVQEVNRNLIEKYVIPEKEMLVNDFLPAAERVLKLSIEAQEDLKDELYLNKLDRIQKNPELPKGINAVYKETPFKEVFVKGSEGSILDSDEISVNDIKQSNYIGDCFFLAALGSLAKANPATIRNMLKDNKNGTYTVTLHLRQKDGSRVATDVTITNEMLYDNNGNLIAAGDGDGELWVMIIEKAYAKAMGGYDNIEDGGLGNEAIEVLTGKSSKTAKITSPTPSNFWANLHSGLSKATTITIGTLKYSKMKLSRVTKDILDTKGEIIGIEEGALKIFAGHLYILDAVDVVNKTIDLRNPHGNNHIKNLSAIQLEDYFESYQEC
jgi:hypothetical protein